jgi:dolichyl-diphosphooligosaccharide--protein glycosyltransferase
MSSNNPPLHDVILWPTILATLSQLFPTGGIETVCYYFPPLLALLCVIGVFFITKLLFNAWAGLFAALLLSSMGGEFMARTIAGSVDYHCLEVFLLVYFVLCVITAVKYHNNGLLNWLTSIVAGFLLAVYLRSWSGAIYLYLIFVISYVLYLIILSIKREAPSGSILQVPCVVIPSTILFYIILAQLTKGVVDNNVLMVSGLFLGVVIVSTLIQIFFVNRGNRWGLLIVSVIILAITLTILYMFARNYFRYVGGIVTSIVEWNAISHTSEERPILIFGNEFSLQALWGNFTTSIFLCLIGIGVLIKKMLKSDRHDLFNFIFIILGTLTMVVSTLAMVRFAYYLAVYTAILSGMMVYLIIEVSTGYLKRNSKKMKWFDKAGDYLLITVMLVFIFVPNFMISKQFTYPLEGSLTGGWEQAMLWMKSNTPEPFADPNYYYANYNDSLKEPEYSVMSWWDYGYWITYIGHRVPTCNPGSTNREIPAIFLTTTDNSKAIKILQQAKSRYIVIDYQTATGKFTAMPTYAEKASKDLREYWSWESPGYIGIFMMGEGEKVQRMTIFYPDYYKSMVVRLFNFDGQAIKSPGCPVIIYKDINGQKWIQKIIDTPSYKQALDYIEDNPLTDGSLYTYGGTDPFLPCVDLEQVKNIRPLKGFGGVNLEGMSQALKQTFEVKIFEYTGEF